MTGLHRMSVFRDDIGGYICLCIYADIDVQLYMYVCICVHDYDTDVASHVCLP